jgi:membrane protein DedA with SNARE-associated domain
VGPRPAWSPDLLALFTDFVTETIATYGYVAIFVLMLLESACVPIPSEVTMLFGGALVTAPFLAPDLQLNSWPRRWGTAGNLAGSWPAWGRLRRPLIDRRGLHPLLRRTRSIVPTRGSTARALVIFGRLLPVIRTFIVCLPACADEFGKFTFHTAAGASCAARAARSATSPATTGRSEKALARWPG